MKAHKKSEIPSEIIQKLNSEVKIRNIIRDASEMNHK